MVCSYHVESTPVFNYHRLETNLLQFLAEARNSVGQYLYMLNPNPKTDYQQAKI